MRPVVQYSMVGGLNGGCARACVRLGARVCARFGGRGGIGWGGGLWAQPKIGVGVVVGGSFFVATLAWSGCVKGFVRVV